MKKYSFVIWDFNGTLLDDTEIGIASQNAVLGRRKMKLIESVEEYRKIFDFPVIEYYKNLGYDFSKEPYDVVANEWVVEYLNRSKDAKLQKGALELVRKLKENKIRQMILSATESDMLSEQTRNLGIKEYFDFIVGTDDIYAAGKTKAAKRFFEREKIDKDGVVLIGDTVHDYDVSLCLGVDCLLLACGHQAMEKLKECQVPVFGNFDELRENFII